MIHSNNIIHWKQLFIDLNLCYKQYANLKYSELVVILLNWRTEKTSYCIGFPSLDNCVEGVATSRCHCRFLCLVYHRNNLISSFVIFVRLLTSNGYLEWVQIAFHPNTWKQNEVKITKIRQKKTIMYNGPQRHRNSTSYLSVDPINLNIYTNFQELLHRVGKLINCLYN